MEWLYMRIVVTGSLAYDYIMDFPGYFKDHILPDKVHMLTVSFLVDSMRRMRGGVAGNIAYNLSLLGEHPLVVASAGQDFGEYREWMESHGIDASGIKQIANEFTASCFINTDKANNQIVAFYTGAMAQARHLTLEGRGLGRQDWVVISPTDPEAMARSTQECRRMGVPYVFDPGKQTPRLEADQILSGLNGAQVLVGNDYELAMMAQKTGKSEEQLTSIAPLSVITRGEKGSTFYSSGENGRIEIPIAPPRELKDPTGAGDAYLAGLVFGLFHQLPLPLVGRTAALIATYAIEQRGCQEHHFTRAEFLSRYRSVFGPARELEGVLARDEPPARR
jgi:adenosine kinase